MAVRKSTQPFSFILNGNWMIFMLLILQQVKCPPTKPETLSLLKICDAVDSPKKLPQACEVEIFPQSSCPHFTLYHCLLSNSSKQNYPFTEKCLYPKVVDRGKCAVLSEKKMKVIQCKGSDCPTEKYLSLCTFMYDGCKRPDIFNRSYDATANTNEAVPTTPTTPTTPTKEQEPSPNWGPSWTHYISAVCSILILVLLVCLVFAYCCRKQLRRLKCSYSVPRRSLADILPHSNPKNDGHPEEAKDDQEAVERQPLSQPDSDSGASRNLTELLPSSHPKNDGHPEVAKDDQEAVECQPLSQPGSDSVPSGSLADILPHSNPKNDGHPEEAKDDQEAVEHQPLLQPGREGKGFPPRK